MYRLYIYNCKYDTLKHCYDTKISIRTYVNLAIFILMLSGDVKFRGNK